MTTGWKETEPLRVGDIFTIQNQFKRRTLLQWLLRKPRQLKLFRVETDSIPGGFFEYTEIRR